MPGSKQAWPNRAACWSPAMPLMGMPAGTGRPSAVTPNRPLGGPDLGQARRRARRRGRSSSSDHAAVADVVEQRAAGVRRLGGVHRAAGEVPEQPGVDGAEGQVGVGLARRPSAEQPLELGGREVRVEHEAGAVADQVAGGRHRVSSSQRSAVRRSCQTMARWRGSPVRRSQTTMVSRWSVMPMAATGSSSVATSSASVAVTAAQISAASCSTQPGPGEVLGELPVGRSPGSCPTGSMAKAADPGGAGVDGEDDCHGRSNLLFCRVWPHEGGDADRRR